jgi:beta-N-acetylhexosaminidase
MVANATVPGLTNLPASISPAVTTGVLRNRLGFSGLVLTDSLSAVALGAAGYSVPRASVAACVRAPTWWCSTPTRAGWPA